MVEISATNELTNQLVLTFTIIVLLAFFIWNKYRYDAISVAALIFLVTISSIPSLKLNIINIDQAFDGFANPAVMTVALVLIISQGLKNAGLSALAGSLVATSAFAGEMSVAGSASLNVEHTNGGAASTGKTFSMGNQLTFTGSGELDNGFTVSTGYTMTNAAFSSSYVSLASIPPVDPL